MIQFRCECGKLLEAKEELVGRLTRCPACDREFAIPSVNENIAPAGVSTPSAAGGRRSAGDPQDYYEDGADLGPSRRSRKAIASLILGLLSFVFFIFAGIPAIICGIVGLKEVSQSQGRIRGTGMAVTGLILGAIGSIVMVPLLLVGLLLPATQKVREAANRMSCQNNLKQIAIGMHLYHDTHGLLPPAVVRDKDGKPLYSWRVLLLPYLEQQSLYEQFRPDEPWDSPNNIQLLSQMPAIYRDPSAANPDPSETVYQVLVGPKTAFEDPKGLNMRTFADGTANTILVVEGRTPVPWTKPADLPFLLDGPLPKMGGHHPGGFNAAFADASVRFLSDSVAEPTLRALITRNGGEGVGPP